MFTASRMLLLLLITAMILGSCEGDTGTAAHAASVSITDRWHFRKYLEDPQIPEKAKQVFNDQRRLEDAELPFYISHLQSSNQEEHAFYFRVITNSYNKKGIRVPEGLANAAYRYVMNNPAEFADYFAGPDAFTDADLTTWSDLVIVELERMTEDQYGRPVIETYLDSLEGNCHNANAQQQRILRRFGRHLTEGWQRYLMNVEQ
ncbi:MAG: hypothetical protein EOO09_01130 [Chitinophagaceae bacterium]|nr:MAG: hypothetical protein EOO09_01130 [Chitinophagaceae bacterium]